MAPSPRGLSLLEALVTIFMMATILLLVSSMVNDLRHSTLSNQDYDVRLGAYQALGQMAQALASSPEITAPVSGSSPWLKLRCWDPGQNHLRLPWPPLSGTALWSPTHSSYLMERRYEVNSGVLLLTQLRSSSSQVQTVRLLGGINELQATRIGLREIRLQLSWTDSRGRLCHSLRHLWAGPP